MTASLALAAVTLAIWLYLIAARGGFWQARVRDDADLPAPPAAWPSVVAVVPARDEAGVVERSVGSLLAQDYAGVFRVILVDDQSRDQTAAVAVGAAIRAGTRERLTVVPGRPLPAGWTGKVWAMHQGTEQAERLPAPPIYVLYTDADILHAPDSVRQLVARAETGRLVLTSLMAKLRCESLAERSLVPAFVFFFQMLYPFSWVNRPDHASAAAAGGCMLVRRDALEAAGGIETIRHALIDDCALASKLKATGPIWLGLTERVTSLRPYPRLSDVGRMVSRSAYDQLHYSPLLLGGTVLGMALTFLAPPLLTLLSSGLPQILGAIAWTLMALAVQPMLRFYRVSPLWGLAMPAIALAYMAFTLASAYEHVRGRGGAWKGRVQANVSELR
jgi:hopene-associated glycosyltransferase HpnB